MGGFGRLKCHTVLYIQIENLFVMSTARADECFAARLENSVDVAAESVIQVSHTRNDDNAGIVNDMAVDADEGEQETEEDRVYFANLSAEVSLAMASGHEHHRYLIIQNISKYQNVRVLIHSALAYGFVPVVVGGLQVVNKLLVDKKMIRSSSFVHYLTFANLVTFLRDNHVALIGIEIGHESQSVLNNTLFTETHIAFILGNEGSGMARAQREACQGLLYIPQYGNGTASLNVSSASAIILNCYHKWLNANLS